MAKLFAQLKQEERTVERITETNATDTQLTLLVKLGHPYSADTPLVEDKNKELKAHRNNLPGPNTDFGFFQNHHRGTVFVAGPLSELFLYDMNGKKLGALTEGAYRILRGSGIEEPEAAHHIKKQNEGRYLLLIRSNKIYFKGMDIPWKGRDKPI